MVISRSKFSLISLLLLGSVLSGCSEGAGSANGSAKPDSLDTDVAMTPEAIAKRVAADELRTSAGRSERDAWTADSEVTAAFPIYRPGSSEVAYYECKVSNAGKDAGSILVNVDESDILIPEATPEGMTTTEQYAELLGHRNFHVVRFDWFRSAALSEDGSVLSSKGFEDASEAQQRLQGLANNDSRVASPLYNREMLDAYYRELRSDASEPASSPGVATVEQAADRTIYSELKNSFSTGVHTPSWYQVRDANDYPVGCGATAWAIVYAYWRQFRGAGKLFDGLDLSNKWGYSGANNYEEIKSAMRSVASAMGTEYGGSGSGKYGLTWPWDMCKGTSYGSSVGYGMSCNRDRGTEYSKFDTVNGSISQDRPVMLLIGADENDIVGNHYVVIEAAEKSQTKYLWVWHDRNVRYLVNYGWGTNDRKWIYVRDWGLNQNDVYSSFSVYTMNLSVPAGPAHGGELLSGHEYKLNDSVRTWSEAQQYCVDRGAHLVTISSTAENDLVKRLLQSSTNLRTWIGLHGSGSSWRWVTGEPFSFTNWIPGEPNNGGGDEQVVELRSAGWNDLPTTWGAATVCEWE
ncbi:MAG TPA: C-type lectin domain-containing protein [Polyangiaceae bacterium]